MKLSQATRCALGAWSVAGGIVFLAATQPVRAGDCAPVFDATHATLVSPCIANAADNQALSTPPAGEGSIRPTHFTVAPVIVIVERHRNICRSRIGGLHGP